MISVRRILLPATCAAALALSACGSSDDDGGSGGDGGQAAASDRPAGTIGMKDLKFEPATLTVKVGETVTWKNEESIPHDVVAKSGADFKSEVFTKDKTYTFTPTEAGTIKYVCTLHPGMDGTLTVTPAQ